MQNRRRYVRVRAGLRFTFAWLEGDESHFELFRTVDLSANGARVVPHEPGGRVPAVGAEGEAAFVLDGAEVRTQVKVVRQTRDGVAVRFVRLSLQDETRVVAWVFRQEALTLSRRIPA